MKKIIAILLTLSLLLTAFALAEETEQIIELGSSGLAVTVDASYYEGEVSTEDTDESQVAYYLSDENLVDFDIYQWAKAEGETLQGAGEAEAAEFGSSLVETSFNDIPAFYYEATEASDGVDYPTVTFLMENGDFFAEIVFWMDGDSEAASDTVEAIMNSLTIVDAAEISEGGNVIALGTSTLKITLPVSYAKGEITEEDTDENQVAYYASEDSLVDFDVYQWAKAEGETLESAAAEEAAMFEAELGEIELNGIMLKYYNAVEESEGVEYNTVTFITEDGEDFVEVVFWLDGENAEETVDTIIGTIAR